MTDPIPLLAERRDESKPRALRRQGKVPGVVYGPKFETRQLQFDRKQLSRVVAQAGTSQFLKLTIAGEEGESDVLVRDVQRDPVTGRVLHIDLYRVLADMRLRSAVPLVQVGTAPALELGGIVSQTLDAVEVECLPRNMPAAIEVDLSLLTDLSSRLTVADLPVPEGVILLTTPDTEIVHVSVPRAMIEEEEEEAEAELLEGEEPVEGETEDGGEEEGDDPAQA